MLGLPHEGITLEWLLQPFTGMFLQPLVTGALLALAIKRPQQFQDIISSVAGDRITLTAAKTGLGLLCGLGSVYRTSNWLSRQVLNNWTFSSKWQQDREVVLVTGGSSGIGEIVVHLFANKGVKVVSLDVQEPRKTLPANVRFIKADITSPKAIDNAAEQIRQELGDPTVLILNAGIGTGETILADSDSMLEKTFQVNTLAHFYLTREFLPSMIKHNHGHVVTVASLASFASIANNVAYSCTKASALAFHEGLSHELKHRYNAPKVRTTVVHPSWTRTPLIAELTADSHFKEFLLAPETIADAIVEQVLKGESAQIILPTRFRILAPFLRGLPSWAQELVRDGSKSLMDADAIRKRSGKLQ